MPPSSLDILYRKLIQHKFFEKGWGKPENLRRLFQFRRIISNRETCYKLVPKDYPVEITSEEKSSDCITTTGKFISPLELHVPNLMPKEVQTAHFQLIIPTKWKDEKHKPVCLHLAGTGDHYFWKRRNFIAKPLLREANMGAIILENPFYGLRKPEAQVRSNLLNVSDIFVMGGCLILESLVLFHWCERNGYGPLGITGLSLGGHIASLAATNWPKPLVLVPCLSWSTASTAFTQGVLSQSINWDMLETQYHADGNYSERLSKMVTIVDDSFVAGQQFVKNFNQSMEALKTDIFEVKSENNKTESICFPPENIIQINSYNRLGLSDSLLDKLISKERYTLNDDEINEINEKVKTIQDKLILDEQQNEFLKDPTIISLETLTTTETKKQTNNNTITASDLTALTKLMNYILPKPTNNEKNKKNNINKTKWWEHEALQFMRGVMDECTHLKNFSIPYDTSLIIAVCAKDDAFIPREGCTSLEEIWPGAEVRYLDGGHVSAYVLYQKLFRSCIIECFDRAKKKAELNNQNKFQLLESTITFEELKAQYDKSLKSYKS